MRISKPPQMLGPRITSSIFGTFQCVGAFSTASLSSVVLAITGAVVVTRHTTANARRQPKSFFLDIPVLTSSHFIPTSMVYEQILETLAASFFLAVIENRQDRANRIFQIPYQKK